MSKSAIAVFFIFLFHCVAWRAYAATINGLLPNGNFEDAPKSSALLEKVIIGELPKWETKQRVEYISSEQKRGEKLLVVPHDGHAVRLGSEGQISQWIHVRKGSFYSLTFSAARTCVMPETLNISVPPLSGNVSINTIYSSNGWDRYAWAFRASSKVVKLTLANPIEDHRDYECGPLIDGVAIKEFFQPKAVSYNLVQNGNFEEGPYIGSKDTTGLLLSPIVEDMFSPLPGWMVGSFKPIKYVDSAHFRVPQGKRAVELVSGLESVLTQTVKTLPGKWYRLSFAVGDAGNACKGLMIAKAFAGKKTSEVRYESKGMGGFTTSVMKFKADAAQTRIAFMSGVYLMRSDDRSSLCGPVVDNVALVAI